MNMTSSGLVRFPLTNTEKCSVWNQILEIYYTHRDFFCIIFSDKNKPAKSGAKFVSYGTDYLGWLLDQVSV